MRALGENLYTAVGVIPHPAGNTEDVCFAFDKPAEAHPLHASANDVAASFERGLRSIQKTYTR